MTAEINYNQLSSELDELLVTLQSDDISVDEAIKLYKRGIAITKQLEGYLKDAENKVSKIKANLDS